jgi:hypothetical protein
MKETEMHIMKWKKPRLHAIRYQVYDIMKKYCWGALQGLFSSLGLGISSRDTKSAHTGRFIRDRKDEAKAAQRSPETSSSLQ